PATSSACTNSPTPRSPSSLDGRRPPLHAPGSRPGQAGSRQSQSQSHGRLRPGPQRPRDGRRLSPEVRRPARRGRGAAPRRETGAPALNRAFLTWVTKRRPYVVLKAAASLDGRIESSSGRSKWITSPAARDLSRRLRAQSDAILVGVNTVLKDNPRLTAKAGL